MTRRFARGPAAVLGLALGLALCIEALTVGELAAAQGKTSSGSPAAPRSGGRVLLAWGVGGVLTSDGTLWQYRPEKSRWVSIDESFRMDGEQRKVLPLPVAAQDVQLMQGFGFLVTKSGACWLYDLDQNLWRNIGVPGR